MAMLPLLAYGSRQLLISAAHAGSRRCYGCCAPAPLPLLASAYAVFASALSAIFALPDAAASFRDAAASWRRHGELRRSDAASYAKPEALALRFLMRRAASCHY